MSEHWFGKEDAYSFERLSLLFVDGHGERHNHRKLQSLEFHWQVGIRWRHGHVRKENGHSLVFAGSDLGYNDIVGKGGDVESCTVAESLSRLNVLDEYDDCAEF